MKNLNALEVPIIGTPLSPPDQGWIKVYFKPEGGLYQFNSSGEETRVYLTKEIHTVALSEVVPVLTYLSDNELAVNGDYTTWFQSPNIFGIFDSEDGTNDGIYTVDSSFHDSGVTEATVLENIPDDGLIETGSVYFPKTVTLEHAFGTKDIHVQILTQEGEEVQVSYNTPDQDTIVLSPEVPIQGDVTVILIG